MIFHLAIPAVDIEESMRFYEKLGAAFGRQSSEFFILKLNGAQIVLHKSNEIDPDPKMYPKHFGFIIENRDVLWGKYYYWSKESPERIFQELFTRYKGLPEEHDSFFLKDPSNNLVEFKWYKNQEYIFA